MPVYANGGAGFTRSLGRSAIFCSMDLPRNLRHMTQPWMACDITVRLLMTQYPACLTPLWVIP